MLSIPSTQHQNHTSYQNSKETDRHTDEEWAKECYIYLRVALTWVELDSTCDTHDHNRHRRAAGPKQRGEENKGKFG